MEAPPQRATRRTTASPGPKPPEPRSRLWSRRAKGSKTRQRSCGNAGASRSRRGVWCYNFGVLKNQMGGSAHFLFVTAITDREEWLQGTLAGLGYELADLESSRGGLVRVFIDAPQGISVEDCARVSHHLTRLFAVEGVDYERLEVSSPGLDRPLKRLADFERFAGHLASVKLKLPVDGRRRFEGCIGGVDAGKVMLEVDGERMRLGIEDIDRARLVPDLKVLKREKA